MILMSEAEQKMHCEKMQRNKAESVEMSICGDCMVFESCAYMPSATVKKHKQLFKSVIPFAELCKRTGPQGVS